MKEKETALNDFLIMIEQSWTYEKMTETEKNKLIELLNSARITSIMKGSFYTRWLILQGIYHAYLIGIGYDGCTWRDYEKRFAVLGGVKNEF